MPFQDQTLQCADCGKDFIFTGGEQEFYQQRGFTNTPKRCEDCRSKRKAQATRSNIDRGSNRKQKLSATCTRCGAIFNPPFEPKPGRPIFCRNCFDASKNR